MMKKDYGNNLSFSVKLEGASKGLVPMTLPNTTFLKEISIKLCKLLDLDRFNSTILFFDGKRAEALSEVSSLRQLHLKNGAVILARIKSTRCPSKTETVLAQSYYGRLKDSQFGIDPKEDADTLLRTKCTDQKLFSGLTVHCVCENSRCVAFMLPKFASRGFGDFGIAGILHQNRCSLCPNNDITNKSMRVVSVILKNCSWKMRGNIRMADGMIIEETYKNQAHRIREADCEIFKTLLSRGNWIDEVLTIRQIVQNDTTESNVIYENK